MIKKNKSVFEKKLESWEKATNDITALFIRKYFCSIRDAEHYWIADQIGGVLYVNDYFFNLDRIIEAIKYDASSEDLFAYYDLELEKRHGLTNGPGVNFKNYLKMK